jgi:hypothetical protein
VCTAARSCGVHSVSSVSGLMGRGSGPRWPRCMPRKRCWMDVNRRAASASVSAATTLTPTIACGLGPGGRRAVAAAVQLPAPAAASRARSATQRHRAGPGGPPVARHRGWSPAARSAPACPSREWPARPGGRRPRTGSPAVPARRCGKPCSSAACRWRRSAIAVWRSVPGARPRPRSMRPGYSVASVPNCSATTSGAWLGSMMPPAPTRMRCVPPAMWPIQHRSGRTGHAVHVVVLGHPVAAIAPGVGVAGQVQRVLQRQRRTRPLRRWARSRMDSGITAAGPRLAVGVDGHVGEVGLGDLHDCRLAGLRSA